MPSRYWPADPKEKWLLREERQRRNKGRGREERGSSVLASDDSSDDSSSGGYGEDEVYQIILLNSVWCGVGKCLKQQHQMKKGCNETQMLGKEVASLIGC